MARFFNVRCKIAGPGGKIAEQAAKNAERAGEFKQFVDGICVRAGLEDGQFEAKILGHA